MIVKSTLLQKKGTRLTSVTLAQKRICRDDESDFFFFIKIEQWKITSEKMK